MITWIVLRAAGIAAYLMLFASVAWGLVGTTSVVGKRVAKPSAIAVHQFLSTVAMVLLGVHLGGLLLDRYMPFRPLDLLVPMHGTFKPVAVTFGIVAMYAAVVVLVSSWLRKSVGTKWWRRLHLLAVPAFGMAMVHGAFAGTDTVRPWMWWMYVATGGLVVFLVLVRGMTAGIRAVRAAHPAGARAARPAARPAVAAAATDMPASAEDGTEGPAPRPGGVRATPRPGPVRAKPAPVPAAAAPAAASGVPGETVVRLEIHVVVDEHGAIRLAPSPHTGEPAAAVASNGHRTRPAEPDLN